jgi:transketolase
MSNVKEVAKQIRIDSVKMTNKAHSGHVGSMLSMAEIVAVLYDGILNVDPKNPDMPDRDRFILSKGHAAAAVYSVLAQKGFIPQDWLDRYYCDDGKLMGHISHKVPGVEFSTGSLGHGVCMAAGMALNAKLENKPYYTYAIVGDGECDEGSVWEMALFANQFKLNRFVVIVDHNKMQSLDFCENTLSLAPFADKWRAFGWNVFDIDGHDHDELRRAFAEAKQSQDKPTVIIANTIKGKGISFMENDILWHYRFPHDGEEYDGALAELYAIKPDGVEDPYAR